MNSNRDRNNCKDCIFYNYLNCQYVKIDGKCSIHGHAVAIDYTYNNNLSKYKNCTVLIESKECIILNR